MSLSTGVGQSGHAQGDQLVGFEALIGSTFADTLDGNSGDNILDGGAGNDSLGGAVGNNTLLGAAGDDRLGGGAGDDLLDGGLGSDTADYSASATAVQISLVTGTTSGGDAQGDTLVSIENLVSTDFADQLDGDVTANRLSGGRGDDTLLGGAGNDILSGGRGADDLQGGDGVDIADYTGSLEGVLVNMTDTQAGGGDAEGDTFSSIEIVAGSFHNDTLIGDAGDSILRGGLGADVIDGGAGFDVADYSTAVEAVVLDLSGQTAGSGEAAGDVLTNIEKVVGSFLNDTIIGSSGDEAMDAGRGDDRLVGGAGSDSYHFGFDRGADIVLEGETAGSDRIVLDADVARKDVSLVREDYDLLIELENLGGFLTDSVRISNHFAETATGIEDIRFGVEDEPVVIDPAMLMGNDATEGVDQLELIAVQGIGGATASIGADGRIHFQGALNQNGDAFFDYTVRDSFGRESTARVEVNLAPVNDVPVALADGVFQGVGDQVLLIPVSALLANDSDVDGDTLTISGLSALYDVNGNALYSSPSFPLTNGKGGIEDGFIRFEPQPDHFGFVGFTYTLSDGNGGATTAAVELWFAGVNDAPRGDYGTTIRLDKVNVISVASLLNALEDPEGDVISFISFGGVSNGTAVLSADGLNIEFTADHLGGAFFTYTVTDARGETAVIQAELTVIPLNDPPSARNDGGFQTFEDHVLIIDPASLLANDTDPNGDVLVISALERFPMNGRVAWTQDGMIHPSAPPMATGISWHRARQAFGQGGT